MAAATTALVNASMPPPTDLVPRLRQAPACRCSFVAVWFFAIILILLPLLLCHIEAVRTSQPGRQNRLGRRTRNALNVNDRQIIREPSLRTQVSYTAATPPPHGFTMLDVSQNLLNKFHRFSCGHPTNQRTSLWLADCRLGAWRRPRLSRQDRKPKVRKNPDVTGCGRFLGD